ncbi:S-methyl-5'-thioadenosine phosphorylase [Thermodesulfovibrio yellowstonii]|uniref:Probable S-methyl-5'-thioinosine phosphorylase n=1 Tax=Thermodesulfovibrio yellowstonii (strain ATCC 51303 / DSM 11347 / YP87) TaxID=289376 RepID=MTIP_THEYD|nr:MULTISPECIES: S-methyl-5'-thioadenosine phosphorylase [Thermodesulfovibrio]B5YKP5.1 RecName: Full=Probable S-methyl-5'-thioinosine phosphorylase; AltName: Full=5'-methylthioinosine phosphorylase; Short=MTI phosphorylase; Short=MTIP [Thermodesulfovibrio yellowstonii DSM 11347]ACI21697.1 S-methyl-5-thioadenosine phosphorylase [Thermodesulfovibrio yellowstonii DSM 11347]
MHNKQQVKIGIIGGSGLSESEAKKEIITIKTPYGEPSCPYEIEKIDDIEVLFLRRHGQKHSIPPHKVNYRANIYGFKNFGIERIFGVFATGSLTENIPPGSIVIPNQIIDFTQGMRANTFYEEKKVVHIDFTEPFCSEIRHYLLETARKIGINVISHATYICVNGPRLETAAEIKFFKNIGADIIGMTIMPEASLAREVEICYAAVAVVANYAAGISKFPLTVKEVIETMEDSLDAVGFLIKETIKKLPEERKCLCKHALKNASF